MPGERITLSLGAAPEWLENVNAYLATPTVQALGPSGGPRPDIDPAVDWLFWAKTLGIAAAVATGFFLLTKLR